MSFFKATDIAKHLLPNAEGELRRYQVRNKTWKIGIVNASKQMGQSRTFRSSSAGESLLSGEDLEDRFLFCVRMLLAPSFSPETGTEAPTMVGGLTLHPRNLNSLYCFFFYCSGC